VDFCIGFDIVDEGVWGVCVAGFWTGLDKVQ